MVVAAWTDKELEIVRSQYGSVPYPEIYASLPERSPRAINQMARKIGMRANLSLSASIRRTGYRRHHVNMRYFSTLRADSCYWAGFIAADGCVIRTPTPRFSVTVSRKDKRHLERLKDAIEFSGDVVDGFSSCKGKKFAISRLGVSVDNSTLDDLERRFSITPRKSLTLAAPSILNSRLVAAFIVGYIDGDGSINWSERDRSFRIGIRGTKVILEWIKSYFDEWFPAQRMPKVSHTEKHPKYQVGGARVIDISKFLLSCSPVSMDRKWGPISEGFR